MHRLTDLVRYADEFLRISEIEDWPQALNGLQIENSGAVTRIGATVDASSATLQAAAERGVNFLIVHHGLFWPGLQPISGQLHRQLKLALRNDIALYSAHLPLDLHPEVGNNVELARSLGLDAGEPFLETKGQPIGRKVNASLRREELIGKLEESLGGSVRCIGAGPMETKMIGIVTGGAGGGNLPPARAGVAPQIYPRMPPLGGLPAPELGLALFSCVSVTTRNSGLPTL